MPNLYRLDTKAMLVRPLATTVAKITVYAKSLGISKTAATTKLIDESPALADIKPDDSQSAEVQSIIDRNTELREKNRDKFRERDRKFRNKNRKNIQG